MKYVKKIVAGFLIIITINLYLPPVTLAVDIGHLAKAEITRHPPESIATPEVDIPGETIETPEKSRNGWLWLAIAVLAVAGGVAGAGSGGGDSSSNDNGSITVNW